jgi:hypothetical protein
MVANAVLVAVPELLSLPVGETYQVTANMDEATDIKAAVKVQRLLLITLDLMDAISSHCIWMM